MYQLVPSPFFGAEPQVVKRLADNAFIPLDPANTDYQRFKQDIADGAELQDAEGNVMTAEQVTEFIVTLP